MGLSEFNLFEVTWLREHGNELIGLTEEEATAAVRATGFRPTIFRPGTATA